MESMPGEMSTPTTLGFGMADEAWRIGAKRKVTSPVPQARSRRDSPGCGFAYDRYCLASLWWKEVALS
jgi:hypothetical protein